MSANAFIAESPREAGLDPQKVDGLFERAAREINEGLLPSCQIAIARNGKIGLMHSFGEAVQGGVKQPATDETIFVIMSATKAITASALWLLIQEGKVRPQDQRRRGRRQPVLGGECRGWR